MTVAPEQAAESSTQQPVHTRALIIGTGFSGLGMAIELQRQGVEFVILEKAAEIGGTWRDNSYPDCACDVPSHLYSFSFEPKATWSKLFSPQPEILDYLKGVTEKYGLRRHIRFNSRAARAHWDDTEYRWHVFTDTGQEYVAQFLISGAGALHIPRLPDIEGLADFQGPAFHSAEWDHDVDLASKRVAVIGTGASAIQIVPGIIRDVAELQLYQRTPPWVVPRPNEPFPDWVKTAFTNVPGLRLGVRAGIYWFLEGLGYAMTNRPSLLRAVEAVAKWNIRRHVAGKELRRRLTPTYRAGCKRILYSPNYYQAVANPKTELITDRIARITPTGIVTADGTERPVDVIVWATGSMSSTRTPTSTSRARAVRTWSIAGIVTGWRHTAASRSPVCRTCSSARAQHRAGSHVGGDHDRIADPLRGTCRCCGGQVRGAGTSAQPRRPAAVQRRAAGETGGLRCGTPVVAGAGISTSMGSTAPCGAV